MYDSDGARRVSSGSKGSPLFRNYLNTFLHQFLGLLLETKRSEDYRESDLQAKKSRALSAAFINLREEQRNRSAQDAGRSRYASTQELIMKALCRDGRPVYAEANSAGVDI